MKNVNCYENTIIDNQTILEFRDDVEREVRSCTDAMKRMAQKIQQMQMLDGFEGEAAESIKTYFSEVHLFLLEAIGEALTECEAMLNQYAMEILCNVDSSPYARIPVSDLLGMQDQVKNRYLGNSSARQKRLYKLHVTASRLSVICTIISIGQTPDMNKVSSQKGYF